MSRLAWLLFALVLGAGGSGRLEEGQRAWEAGDAAGALVQWSLALAEAEDEAQRFEALVRLATVNRELGRLGASMDALESAGKVVSMAGPDRRIPGWWRQRYFGNTKPCWCSRR